MAEWNDVVKMPDYSGILESSRELAKPLPTALDKIAGYLGDYRKIQTENLDYRKKQQGFADEQEMRKAQKEMGDDFKANPPANAEEWLKRSADFYIKWGKPEMAQKFFDQHEKVKAERETKGKQQQATIRQNFFKMALKDPAKFAIAPDEILALAGITRDVAQDMAKLASDPNEKVSNIYQFLGKYGNDPEKKQMLIEFEAARAGAKVGAESEARLPSQERLQQNQFGQQNQIQQNQFDNREPTYVRDPVTGKYSMIKKGVASPVMSGTTQLYGDSAIVPPSDVLPGSVADGTEIPQTGMTPPPPAPGLSGNLGPINDGQFGTGVKPPAVKSPPSARWREPMTVKQHSTEFRAEPVWKALKQNTVDTAEQAALEAYKKTIETDNTRTVFQKRQALNSIGYTQVFKYIRALDNSVVRPSELTGFMDKAHGGFTPEAVIAKMKDWLSGATVPEHVARDFEKILEATGRDLKSAYYKIARDRARTWLVNDGSPSLLGQVLGGDQTTASKVLQDRATYQDPRDVEADLAPDAAPYGAL